MTAEAVSVPFPAPARGSSAITRRRCSISASPTGAEKLRDMMFESIAKSKKIPDQVSVIVDLVPLMTKLRSRRHVAGRREGHRADRRVVGCGVGDSAGLPLRVRRTSCVRASTGGRSLIALYHDFVFEGDRPSARARGIRVGGGARPFRRRRCRSRARVPQVRRRARQQARPRGACARPTCVFGVLATPGGGSRFRSCRREGGALRDGKDSVAAAGSLSPNGLL